MALTSTMREFIKRQRQSRLPASKYFKGRGYVVYLRASQYHFDPVTRERQWALGVANVTVRPSARRKGTFSRFMRYLEAYGRRMGYEVVRVEEVGNPVLLPYLTRIGYNAYDDQAYTPIMFKRLEGAKQ